MFTARYFNPRYWASRYWAKVGAEAVIIPVTVNYFFTANKQIAFTTNINLPVYTADKTVSLTSNLGR